MTPKSSHKGSHQRNSSHVHQISDYDTDTAALTDTGLLQPLPPPTRTNEELNLTVLRRHNPSITGILSIAPYAVVYNFSATSSTWEKRGVEGTLFVVQLSSDQLRFNDHLSSESRDVSVTRFGVVVLNRRGLDNFEAELKCSEDVEITEEYVILQVRNDFPGQNGYRDEGSGQELAPDIIGLWIFSEPPPSSTAQARVLNAQVIQECAKQAEISRKLAEEASQQARLRQEQARSMNGQGQIDAFEDPTQDDALSIPMGRQLSLRQLFGQQRQDDDAWSVRGHNSPRDQPSQKFLAGQIPQHPHFQQTNSQQLPNPLHPQNTAQQSVLYPAPGSVSQRLVASPQQPSLPLMQPRSTAYADAPLFTNGRGHMPPNLLSQMSGQSMPGMAISPGASHQDVLLDLFQRARDGRD